jgi:hypothetical protein
MVLPVCYVQNLTMSDTKLFNIRLDVDDGERLQKMAAQFDMSANSLAKHILTAGVKALAEQPGRLVLPVVFSVSEPGTLRETPSPVLNEVKHSYKIKR